MSIGTPQNNLFDVEKSLFRLITHWEHYSAIAVCKIFVRVWGNFIHLNGHWDHSEFLNLWLKLFCKLFPTLWEWSYWHFFHHHWKLCCLCCSLKTTLTAQFARKLFVASLSLLCSLSLPTQSFASAPNKMAAKK